MKKIGTLLFDDVELLDFAGPLQVFSSLSYLEEHQDVETPTIGLTPQIKVSKNGLHIQPDHTIDSFQGELDVLVIPGGMGTRAIIKDDQALSHISELIGRSSIVASVCTGSLILAKLGKLNGLKATTHYAALDILTKLDPSIIVDRSKRYHDHGSVIVSEGVSAGIDMSLHLIKKHVSPEAADTIRKYIEYYPEPYEK